MPDQNGHSWIGLAPRTCVFCEAVEGTKAVHEPCPEVAATEIARLNGVVAALDEELDRHISTIVEYEQKMSLVRKWAAAPAGRTIAELDDILRR